MIDWWNPPKAMTYIPINVFGPDDGYQISHPKEMEWAQAEDAAVGIEIEEKYCEIAAKRLSQEVLQF